MLDYSAMKYVEICREMRIIGMVSLVKYKIKQQHLGNTLTLNYEYVQHIISLHHANITLDNIYNSYTLTDTSTFISNLICDNVKILHNADSSTSNFLIFLEAPCIKFLSPSLDSGLKASKELTLFSQSLF